MGSNTLTKRHGYPHYQKGKSNTKAEKRKERKKKKLKV
jgi:hypothetical protein